MNCYNNSTVASQQDGGNFDSLSLYCESLLRFQDIKYNQNSYEITINGFQVRKINEIGNVIFGLRYGKPSSAFRPKLGCSPS